MSCVLDYPDFHQAAGRQVMVRWIRSQLRREDIPETQLLQENNCFFAQTLRLAGHQHPSSSASLWIPTTEYPFPSFQEIHLPFSRGTAHTTGSQQEGEISWVVQGTQMVFLQILDPNYSHALFTHIFKRNLPFCPYQFSQWSIIQSTANNSACP